MHSPHTQRTARAGMAALPAIVLVGALVSACHTPPEAAPRMAPLPALQQATRPVASVLDVHWLVPGTDTMVISRESDAAPVVNPRNYDASDRARVGIGMTIQRVRHVIEPDGRDVFEVAFEQRDSSSILVETTTWVDARTLRPLHQTALLEGGRVVSLVFGHDRLVVTDSAPERPLRMTISPVPDSAYTSAAVDLLLRALPLAIGYHATVPVYFPADEQVSPLDVRVEGADRITTRSGRTAVCWIVAADFPGDVTERFWIDQRSHAMVRILAHDGPAALVRYDR